MKIKCLYSKLLPLNEIIPCEYNRNKHSQKQIEMLAKIIARNGQRACIVISNLSGKVVKGHGRLEAIKLLGWEKAAVEYQDYEDEVEELRDRVADNEIARYAEFDKENFIGDLKDLDLDLGDFDFEEFGLKDFNLDDGKVKEKLDDVDISGSQVDGNDFVVITFENNFESEECRNKLGMKNDQRSIKYKDCVIHD